MRWDHLFDDLEAQLEHELGAQDDERRAEEERLRLARLPLRNRIDVILRGARPRPVLRIEVTEVGTLHVRPTTIGRDWLAGELVPAQGAMTQILLPLRWLSVLTLPPGLAAASLRAPASESDPPRIAERVGLAFFLRDLARRRRYLHVHLGDEEVHGTIDRVGADHFDLAVHPLGTPRRESAVTGIALVTFTAVRCIRL